MNDTTKTTTNETAEPKKARKPRKDKGVKKGSKNAGKPASKAKAPKTTAKPKKATPKTGKGSIILPEYRSGYKVHVLQDADGKKSRTVDNGDAVSNKLRGESLDKLYSICRDATGIARTELEAKYAKLNVGQQAMNLRNRIRAAVAAGYKL